MFQKLFVFFILLVISVGIATADDIPVKPHEFYGAVTINGAPAPTGTTIVAKMWGGSHGEFTTTSAGIYGDPGPFDDRLRVQVDANEYNSCCVACGCSLQIEFYVNGVKAQVYDVKAGTGWTGSYTFQPETSTQLNLNTGVLPGPTISPTTSPTTSPSTTPTISPTTPRTTVPTAIPTETPTPRPTSLPSLPHSFYGTVVIGMNTPAPEGTVIEARAPDIIKNGGNPITVTNPGLYGGPGSYDPKLEVQGYLENGTPIEFYVSGSRAEVSDGAEWSSTYPFTAGAKTELNLRANLSPPVADFIANPVIGSEVLSVQFTDLSTGPPASYYWEFGDGQTSTLQNPVHKYYNGLYTVNLTVTNVLGEDTLTRPQYITVYRRSSPGGGGGGGGGGGYYTVSSGTTPTVTPTVTPTPIPTVTTGPVIPGGTLPLNSDLALSQSVTIASPDNTGFIFMVAGMRPTTSLGEPLLTLSIRRIPDSQVPPVPAGALFSYAGYAYEIEPSGAAFDPYITLAITVSEDDWAGLQGRQLFLKWYNPDTSAWEDLPATIDAAARTVSAKITHTSVFALFAESLPTTAPTAVPTTMPASPGFGGILSYLWILLIVVIIIAVVLVVIMIQKRRGEQEEEMPEEESWKME